MNLTQALFALSAARGPAGGEWVTPGTSVIETAKALLEPLADRVWVDGHGSLLGIRENPGKPRVLLDAHLDEVCLYITGQEEGYLTFRTIGLDPRILPDQCVRILGREGEISGVITCLPPHVLTTAQQDKPFDQKELFIDCGQLTEAQASALIGCPAVFATEPFLLGEGRICGKSLDDRSCWLMLLRAMELVKDEDLAVEVCLLGSTQEETGGSGAAVGAYALNPNWAIAADVTFADSPDSPKADTFPLGGGPTIGWGPTLNRALSQTLRDCAEELKLSWSLEILPHRTGTNADPIAISREGVPTALVSLPLRYMHEPMEVIDLKDLEAGAQLVAQCLRRLGKEETA